MYLYLTEEFVLMKRMIFALVSAAAIIFAAFSVTAAEIQSDGTRIVITNETEDTVWIDSNGGRAVWDKQNATLTLDNFNLKGKSLGIAASLRIDVKSVTIIVNGQNSIENAEYAYYALMFTGKSAVFKGSGVLSVKNLSITGGDPDTIPYDLTGIYGVNADVVIDGPTIIAESGDFPEQYIPSPSASGSTHGAMLKNITVNSGSIEAYAGKSESESCGISSLGAMKVNNGYVKAKGEHYGINFGYSAGRLEFEQYANGYIYASGGSCAAALQKSDSIADGTLLFGSENLNAGEDEITAVPEISQQGRNLFYFTIGENSAKTMLFKRDNERIVSFDTTGAEIGSAADSTVTLPLYTKNIKPEEVPVLTWYGENEPAGITAEFSDGNLVLSNDGTAQDGTYAFGVSFGEQENKVSTGKISLYVGECAAKIVKQESTDTYFSDLPSALAVAQKPENDGCVIVLLSDITFTGNLDIAGNITLDCNGKNMGGLGVHTVKDGALVTGNGHIDRLNVGEGGRLGAGLYDILIVDDGKTITEHLAEGYFCTKKNDTTKDILSDEFSAVTIMADAYIKPVPFYAVPRDNTTVGYEQEKIVVDITANTYYGEANYFRLDQVVEVFDDGTESVINTGTLSTGFEDKNNNYTDHVTIEFSTFKTLPVGEHKLYMVFLNYLGKNEKGDAAELYAVKTGIFTLNIEKSPAFLSNIKYRWLYYDDNVYTGQPQGLINTKYQPEVVGGKIQYRLSENDEWQDEIPTATDVGEYKVYVRIVGDENHTDYVCDEDICPIAYICRAAVDYNNGAYRDPYLDFQGALERATDGNHDDYVLNLYENADGFDLDAKSLNLAGGKMNRLSGNVNLTNGAKLFTKAINFLSAVIIVDDSSEIEISGGKISGNVSGNNILISDAEFENVTFDGNIINYIPKGYALADKDGNLVNIYKNSVEQTCVLVKHTANDHKLDENGVCGCGWNKVPEKNENGAYMISEPEELLWFSYWVNMGNNTSNAVLLNDIDLSELSFVIGSVQTPYMGTFDGCGKTVNNLNLHVTHNDTGLFGSLYGAKVRNFSINGKITADSVYTHIGSVAGSAKADSVISQIVSDVDIESTAAIRHVGGIVGSPEIDGIMGSLLVENCIYTGTINSPDSDDSIGGILGYANADVTIKSCGFAGSITAKSCKGGILGYVNNANFGCIINSYSCGTVNGAQIVGIVGKGGDKITDCYYTEGTTPFYGNGAASCTAVALSKDAWTNGEAVFYLNGKKLDEHSTWKQTLGEDAYPNFSGKTVYIAGKDMYRNQNKTVMYADGENICMYNFPAGSLAAVAVYSGNSLVNVKYVYVSEKNVYTFGELGITAENGDGFCIMLFDGNINFKPLCEAVKISLVK